MNELPTRVAVHFNMRGEANGWGPKTFVWILPVIATLLYGVLTLVASLARFFNVPFAVKLTNPQVLALLRQLVIVLKTYMLAIFAYIS